jgi:cell division protein FtsB
MGNVMKTWILAVVMLGAVGAYAQDKGVDPETYKAAVERLKARAATGPSEADRLRAENAELRATVTDLKAQIQRLRAEADQQAKANPPTPAKQTRPLKVGMTLAEVKEVMGGEGEVDTESAEQTVIQFRETDNSREGVSKRRSVWVTFKRGKAVEISYGQWDVNAFKPSLPSPPIRGDLGGTRR